MNTVVVDGWGLTKLIQDLQNHTPGVIGGSLPVRVKVFAQSSGKFVVYLKRHQYATLADLARTRSVEESYRVTPA
jgi:hypothetical protein